LSKGYVNSVFKCQASSPGMLVFVWFTSNYSPSISHFLYEGWTYCKVLESQYDITYYCVHLGGNVNSQLRCFDRRMNNAKRCVMLKGVTCGSVMQVLFRQPA